jgi:xanthine dehydrogenase YagS FAD-binding subunit
MRHEKGPTMKAFRHLNAPNMAAAVAALREPETAVIAGGTDLLTVLKAGIQTPKNLVNLKTISALDEVQIQDKTLHIGALATLDTLEHGDVAAHFPLIARAASLVASPQIRHAATIGGNLCQHVRCWYYRHPEVHCWLKGGRSCFARQGRNRLHALFGKSPCVAVNPSDLAPVLTALEAELEVIGLEGPRRAPIDTLYALPEPARRRQTTLEPAQVLADVTLALPDTETSGIYLKIMERAAWSFAIVSAAVKVQWNGDRVEDIRIVLGGVAGKPWRVPAAEQEVQGRRIDPAAATASAEAAVREAAPLPENHYKIPLVKNLVRRALLELSAPKEKGGR